MPLCLRAIVLFAAVLGSVQGLAGIKTRSFVFSPKIDDKPKLILISGCPGTGKSTFGMSVALDQGILKCISTDTVRAVMRSFVTKEVSPALHRSSYAAANENDDPVRSWLETCTVLSNGVEDLVDDAINRGQSLVFEGVHIIPSRNLIDKWVSAGGVATGCMLKIKDAEAHKMMLRRRGFITGKGDPEEEKIKSFDRIRAIQDDMVRRAEEAQWLLIEQKLDPDPLEMISNNLLGVDLAPLSLPKSETKIDLSFIEEPFAVGASTNGEI
mmetsp:Transcript_60442/g.89663  ORF Transcript_60442/g.89663 Transcript_60442/m.89663 type:complete len:269 (+) Transcript_60442:65-871(+)